MASVDKLKQNLTDIEAHQVLDSSTRGKVFEDGPYRYRIFVSMSIMDGNSSVKEGGMIVTLVNTPDRIGGDLITYALKRIRIILRNFKKKVMIMCSKIWVDEYGHDINFMTLIGGKQKGEYISVDDADAATQMYTSFSMTEFNETNERVLAKLNKVVNLIIQKTNNMELPAVPEPNKRDVNRLFKPVMDKMFPVVSAKVKSVSKLPPIKFEVKGKGIGDVVFGRSRFDNEDGKLRVKYYVEVTIVADKTHPMIKMGDKVSSEKNNRTYGATEESELFRKVTENYKDRITKIINNYFDNYCPVDIEGVKYSYHMGTLSSGTGLRDY